MAAREVTRLLAGERGRVPDAEGGVGVEGEALSEIVGLVEAPVLDAGSVPGAWKKRSICRRSSRQRSVSGHFATPRFLVEPGRPGFYLRAGQILARRASDECSGKDFREAGGRERR